MDRTGILARRFAEAPALRLIGTAHAALGESGAARERRTQAIALLEPIRPPRALLATL